MRHTLLYIALLITMPAYGQMSFQNDTIKISEVIISRKKINTDPAGYKKTTIDSAIMKNYSHGTLAEILSENSGIFIKGYGMGGTATPSLRGTGASNTQISWNGINIDHPMLGQSDLSLLPSGMVDDIQIYFGGASMALNSGGIGGIINLETKPVWKKETLITLNPGIGSFGRYTGLVAVKTGTINFQTVTKAFIQSSENDFRYLNTEISHIPVWETRKNSQVLQQGFIQELYYRKSNNVASARIWYQSAYRNLPSSMLTQQPGSNENQFDESIRVMLNYDINKERGNSFITGAWMMNRLNYTNRLASIDSRNLSDILTMKGGMDKRIGESTKLKVVLTEELNVIKSNNYDQNVTRNTTTLTASAEYKSADRFGATILVREILDKNKLLIPDFSAGAQIRIVDSKEYFLKANISRNSKIPTMNDMFWVPGGNPDLKNEYAFIYEFTYEMIQKISAPLTFSYDLSVFKNTIKDMIQWHPGEYSYWTADNIQNVNSMGLETSLSFNYSLNNVTSVFNAGYSFTKATNGSSKESIGDSAGKQLMYIPENQANASLRLSYMNYYTSWVSNMTGRRYITVDNSNYLPGYLINSITTGFKLKMERNLLDLNFNINNLFNINYQTIAYYPLPGRSYNIKILFQLLK